MKNLYAEPSISGLQDEHANLRHTTYYHTHRDGSGASGTARPNSRGAPSRRERGSTRCHHVLTSNQHVIPRIRKDILQESQAFLLQDEHRNLCNAASQYHTHSGSVSSGGATRPNKNAPRRPAVSAGAHAVIIFQQATNMPSPESDDTSLRGAEHF